MTRTRRTAAEMEAERRPTVCRCGRELLTLRRINRDALGRTQVMGGEAAICTHKQCVLYTDVAVVESWVPEYQVIA